MARNVVRTSAGRPRVPRGPKARGIMEEMMGEFKRGQMHSGRGKAGKKGPVVRSRAQAIAIALSKARKGKK